MLGGANSQIPAIRKAREMGHYIITCDYLEDNPGHKYAHEYYNVNTTDKEAVLSLAKSLKIDGIVCYDSEAAAPTVAYVAEQLGLPSQPYQSVEILSNKDQFREFLREHGFHVPRAKGYDSLEDAIADFYCFRMPVMIKPVDSSGSRGVTKIHSIDFLPKAVESALSFSRAKRFIVEEFIEKQGFQVGGDGFSVNGKLVFYCFCNEHFAKNSLNPFVPICGSWPCNMSEPIQNKIKDEVQRVLDLLGMKTGAYNFDIFVDAQDNVYLLEIAARNGGGWIPLITKYVTGVDMIEYTIRASLGEDCSDLKYVKSKGYWSSYEINSMHSGIFKNLKIDEDFLKNNMVKYELLVKPGDEILPFTGSHRKLGTMLFKHASMSEMFEKIDDMAKWVDVIVEDALIKNR